jgi:hypothetical protein
LFRRQHQVLHLRATDALDAHVERAACQGLGDNADKLRAVQQSCVDLDDEAEDVLSVEEDRARVGERELSRRDRLERRGGVHDERIPARAGEGPDAASRPAVFVVDPECHGFACRGRAGPFLLEFLAAVDMHMVGEDAVEDELLGVRRERCLTIRRRCGQWAQPKPVDQTVRERVGRLGEGERVHDHHEPARSLWGRERVDVGDVGDRIGQGARP